MEEIDERHPDLLAGAARRIRTSAGCSSAPPTRRGWCSAAQGRCWLAEDRVEGEDPLEHFSPTAAQHLLPHRRLRARRRHHGRQLLRPRARRGLRVRGADLLPRRPRRPADPGLHPAPAPARRPARSRSSAPPPSIRCSGNGAGSCTARGRSTRPRDARSRHRPRSAHDPRSHLSGVTAATSGARRRRARDADRDRPARAQRASSERPAWLRDIGLDVLAAGRRRAARRRR